MKVFRYSVVMLMVSGASVEMRSSEKGSFLEGKSGFYSDINWFPKASSDHRVKKNENLVSELIKALKENNSIQVGKIVARNLGLGNFEDVSFYLSNSTALHNLEHGDEEAQAKVLQAYDANDKSFLVEALREQIDQNRQDAIRFLDKNEPLLVSIVNNSSSLAQQLLRVLESKRPNLSMIYLITSMDAALKPAVKDYLDARSAKNHFDKLSYAAQISHPLSEEALSENIRRKRTKAIKKVKKLLPYDLIAQQVADKNALSQAKSAFKRWQAFHEEKKRKQKEEERKRFEGAEKGHNVSPALSRQSSTNSLEEDTSNGSPAPLHQASGGDKEEKKGAEVDWTGFGDWDSQEEGSTAWGNDHQTTAGWGDEQGGFGFDGHTDSGALVSYGPERAVVESKKEAVKQVTPQDLHAFNLSKDQFEKMVYRMPEDPALRMLKKMYHKKALKLHPDHGGSHEEMRDFQAAYTAIQNAIKGQVERAEQRRIERDKRHAGSKIASVIGKRYRLKKEAALRKIEPYLNELGFTLSGWKSIVKYTPKEHVLSALKVAYESKLQQNPDKATMLYTAYRNVRLSLGEQDSLHAVDIADALRLASMLQSGAAPRKATTSSASPDSAYAPTPNRSRTPSLVSPMKITDALKLAVMLQR